MSLFALLPLFAVLAGAAAGGGLFLFAVALRGLPPPPADKPPGKDRLRRAAKFLSTQGSIAVLAGFVVLVVTRWPVAAIGAGALVLSWKGIAGGAAEERMQMRRLEALAAWTESLRDTIAGAVGLEQAIPASTRAAAPVLQPSLGMLVDRLRTRMPLPDALQMFADDLDDPSADLVVAGLKLNARLRGPGLRQLLDSLSAAAREELDMRRRVEASRRSTRRSVQIVVGVTLGVAAILAVFNRGYVEPYSSLIGQLVLVLVLGMFAAGFLWLKRLAKFDKPDRLLQVVATTAGAPPTQSQPQSHQPQRQNARAQAGSGQPAAGGRR